uniref:Doublesex- and mab-3-related transcription factor C1/C2 C-terminal domain-containing protein n=1 Tax=Macaca nemestrina TaxID=9545 RepID=A0A2K6CU65_MACNE
MAAPPKASIRVRNIDHQSRSPHWEENSMLQPETTSSQSSQGALLLGQQQLVSPSGDPTGPPCCSIDRPCATLDPLLLQPQVPKVSDQALVSAHSEWQRKLEAAEALLTLRNSAQAPPDSISLHQPCNPPAPAGDKGFQPPSPSLRPRPASSISLPIGHLGCISLLS